MEENSIETTDYQEEKIKHTDAIPVSGMYENWFLDYASYVILERAVPALEDGLKPVQRRILHSMKEMDDGRFNKIANVIGHTMQYHPHGDASIGDAIVNLGQKDLLIDTQGNWGDIRTGDNAAAARYIEGRLSKFALEILFNPQTTEWQLSYDGRKKEPITLPVKFPLLLAQGVEGIAVGLATKIMPHNFGELLKASIQILHGKETQVFPDFQTGGMIDVTNYNDGLRGGKLRVRAKIEEYDRKTLVIKDIPYTTTTGSLMDSIVKANDTGKIKIRRVTDNTAKEVEILVTLAPNTSPTVTIDALYAFTDCEVSISPNSCIIVNEKPKFLGISKILEICTQNTLELLRQELEIRKAELMEKLLFSSLEKIFIENKIYRDIEEAETWKSVLHIIDKRLEPYKPDFYRKITQEDIIRLTEIRIKRISKFDTFKANELMKNLIQELQQVEFNLENLVNYAIKYFKNLLRKYGKGRERKTEIRGFDTINAAKVAANNQKLYVDFQEGFIGYALRKAEFIAECSDIDDIIIFFKNGTFKVVRIAEKLFVGKGILHISVFNRNDKRLVYNLAYLDGKTGTSYVKRFQIGGVTREREYTLTTGEKGSKILYFTVNPNGEAEIITVKLTQGSRAKNKVFDYNFAQLAIKGRNVKGNILTKQPIKSLRIKSEGISTLGGVSIYFDSNTGRLNTEKRGKALGAFDGQDRILAIYKNGTYEMTDFNLTNGYDLNDLESIQKFDNEQVITTVYKDGESKSFYLKRFQIDTKTLNKSFNFTSEAPRSQMLLVSLENEPSIEITYQISRTKTTKEILKTRQLTDIQSRKSKGRKLPNQQIKEVSLIEDA